MDHIRCRGLHLVSVRKLCPLKIWLVHISYLCKTCHTNLLQLKGMGRLTGLGTTNELEYQEELQADGGLSLRPQCIPLGAQAKPFSARK